MIAVRTPSQFAFGLVAKIAKCFGRRLQRPVALSVISALAFCPLCVSAEQTTHAKQPIPKSIEPFFRAYCYECHGAATAKADLNFEDLTRSIANSTNVHFC